MMAHRAIPANQENVSDDESISETESCSDSVGSDGYDPEWLDEVSESGDLFYVGASLPSSQNTGFTENTVENGDGDTGDVACINSNVSGSKKVKNKGKGKLKSLINYNKVLKNGDLGPREVPGAEDTACSPLPKVTFQDPRGEVKEVYLDVDPKRHNYGRRASPCEVLFGIVPGRFQVSRGGNRNRGYLAIGSRKDDDRIMVQGLIPDGEAIRSQAVKIGDWLQSVNGLEVTFSNIPSVLSTITFATKVKLTLQRFAGQQFSEEAKNHAQPVHKTRLAKLVSQNGHKEESLAPGLNEIPHVVLYLTIEGISEFGPNKQDVLYQFPDVDIVNKLVQVRGMFITIAHMLPDITGSHPLSSTLVVDDRLMHVGYAVEGNEILVIVLPDDCVPLIQLHQLMKDVVRLLRLQYHSLHQAFTQQNKSALDHMFVVCLHRLLRNRTTSSLLGRNGVQGLIDTVPAAWRLTLPPYVQVEIETTITDFESSEFVDMSDDYYDARRSYNIIGTCLFYKSYLLANHLPKEDLVDVYLYLTHYGLLALTRDEPVSRIVIWKEVHPTRRGQPSTDTNAEMLEPQGRYFYLIVGLKQQLFATLLEAGGCSSKADGNPGPDPFYIDQAQATILQLESLHIPEACDTWLNAPNVPAIANVDYFLQSGRGNKEESFFRARDPSPGGTPSNMKGVPANLRKSQTELTSILKKKSSTTHHLTATSTVLGDNESDTSHSMGTSATSSMSDETTPVMARRERWSPSRASGSDAESRTSSDGALHRGEKKSRMLAGGSTLELNSLYKNLPECNNVPLQLTAGCENILFHYVQLESADGVLMAPHQHDLSTMLSTEVYDNFQASCLMIQQVFHNTLQYKEAMKNKEMPRLGIDHSLGLVKEHGVLFQCSLPPRPNQKKPSPTLTYWVVGRLFSGVNPREVYICFLDSAPQNAIELAFKLGFGVTV